MMRRFVRWPAKTPMNLLRVCITLWLLGCSHATWVSAQDAPLIERARQVSVASLDSGFPAMPFEQWLATLRRLPTSAPHWEVNDCGEGADGREAPTCVEAILDLVPDTTAHASLIMAGLDGTAVEPAVWMLYAMTPDSIAHFKQLREWAAFVRHRAR